LKLLNEVANGPEICFHDPTQLLVITYAPVIEPFTTSRDTNTM